MDQVPPTLEAEAHRGVAKHVASPGRACVACSYVGSAEHETYPSPAGAPKLRHNDASACDPRYVTFDEPTRALRESICFRWTSDFVGGFPKYVWGRLNGELYEARLVNHERGTYKGYRLGSPAELPDDPHGVLGVLRHA